VSNGSELYRMASCLEPKVGAWWLAGSSRRMAAACCGLSTRFCLRQSAVAAYPLLGDRCSGRIRVGRRRLDMVQAAEAAVSLVVKAGRPIQKIGSAEGGTIAEEEGP
jgi:hypothetical protein